MRIKTVMKDDMVAHVWANQSQAHARNGRRSFYFDGRTIYSYGSHFPIATFVTNKQGERAVFVTTRSYSNTTSKHQRLVNNALHGLNLPRFDVHEVPVYGFQWEDKAALRQRFEAYAKRLKEHIERSHAPRISAGARIAAIRAALTEAADQATFARFFRLCWKLATVPQEELDRLPALREEETVRQLRIEAQRQARHEGRAAAWREVQEQMEREKRERREAWLAGERVRIQYSDFPPMEPTRLRVIDDRVETSRGAEVPLEHAKRLWPVIEKVRERGEAFVTNGRTIHVGHFNVDRIEPTGDMVVGCHQIPYDETRKIAEQLGLTNRGG